MRGFRVQLALIVILLAVLGALLHPLALLLAISPFDPRGVIRFMEELRSVIADLLGWGLLSLLAVMAFFVLRGRLTRKARATESQPRPATTNARPARAVVAITGYNDSAATAAAVREFKRQPAVREILVVDNNSTDDTAALAAAAGARVVQEHRQGYGYACIRGLTEALQVSDADVIVLTEGDGTFFAEDLPKFLAYVDHSDLVVGNRVVRDLVDGDSQMDYFFTWGNMAVAMLLRLRFWDGRHLGPAGLMDVGCTYRAIRREALERILPDLVVGGNTFSPHMLLVALARGLSVVEIPIRFRRRVGESKGASQSLRKGIQVGLAMIWQIMTFRLLAPDAQRPAVAEGRSVDVVPGPPDRAPNGDTTSADEPAKTRAGVSR